MYYNIKIKSNGSEFILESNNRSVTQKEMDIYFAHIFGASSQFCSALDEKKIISDNSENLKSIYDIEELANPKTVEQDENPTIAEEKTEQINFKSQEPEINIQEEDKPKIKSTETISFVNESSFDVYQEYIINNNTLSPERSLEIDKLYQNNQEKLNEIFTQEDKIEQHQEEEKEADTASGEEKSMREIVQETIAQGSIMPDIELEPVAKDMDFMEQIKEDKVQTFAQYQAENKINTSDFNFDSPKDDTTKQEEPLLSKIKSEVSDFEEFLKGVKETNNLADEFIVCAYYIKNVLGQNNFTMKFINSKLFQFCGKIADMSTVDELIQKEYIRLVGQVEYKLYSITHLGEDYFSANFRE